MTNLPGPFFSPYPAALVAIVLSDDGSYRETVCDFELSTVVEVYR